MKWELIRHSGKYQWILKSNNGRILLSTIYMDPAQKLNDFLNSSVVMSIDGSRVERKKGSASYQLVLKNRDGSIIAYGQTYRSVRSFSMAKIKVILAMETRLRETNLQISIQDPSESM